MKCLGLLSRLEIATNSTIALPLCVCVSEYDSFPRGVKCDLTRIIAVSNTTTTHTLLPGSPWSPHWCPGRTRRRCRRSSRSRTWGPSCPRLSPESPLLLYSRFPSWIGIICWSSRVGTNTPLQKKSFFKGIYFCKPPCWLN